MVVTAPSVEKVVNGEYDQGRGPWSTAWNAAGLSMSSSIDTTSKLSGVNSCKLVISQATGTDWHLQYYQNLNTKAGYTYELTYTAAANINTSIVVALQETHSPYSSFISHTPTLTTSPQTFTISNIAPDNDNVNLTFMLAGSAPRTIWIDAISITETSNDPDPQNCADVYASGVELSSDFSGDCRNDLEDFALLASYWLQTGCTGGTDCDLVDLVNDNTIDILDLNNWVESLWICNDPQDQTCMPTW